MLGEDPSPSALHHDFYVHGVVPSVTFVVDIPESSNDSFYQGKAYVCLKDKGTQPSSPLRHSTELNSLLLKHYSDNGLVLTKPVLVVVSNGGPDHRITYASVQVALLVCSYPST